MDFANIVRCNEIAIEQKCTFLFPYGVSKTDITYDLNTKHYQTIIIKKSVLLYAINGVKRSYDYNKQDAFKVEFNIPNAKKKKTKKKRKTNER